MIFCQTLGPPVVRLDDGSAPASLQWRKNLALLVYLARSPKRARRRDHLLGLLWGDQPQEKARASLNQVLLTLRSYVGPALESDKAEVRLTDGAVTLDVEQLDALAASCSSTHTRTSACKRSCEHMPWREIPGAPAPSSRASPPGSREMWAERLAPRPARWQTACPRRPLRLAPGPQRARVSLW